MPSEIWGKNIKLEVVGVTGEYSSGKTLFALSIDPAKTRCYDFEKSGGDYGGLGAERIDVPDELGTLHPNGYRPIDLFTWWLKDVREVKRGQYTVIAVDTVGDIETGLADYVASRCKDYGFSSPDRFRAVGGIFWGYVKSYWKTVLADLASRCDTFVFTSHLRQVWEGGKPTKDKAPQGKSTLEELASLYLWLDRDGKTPGEPPAADVLKSRVAITELVDGAPKITQCLPPRLPIATPNAIREYIQSPVGDRKLRPPEKPRQQKPMTEDQRLLIEERIASDKRAAAEAAAEVVHARAEQATSKPAAAKANKIDSITGAATEGRPAEPKAVDAHKDNGQPPAAPEGASDEPITPDTLSRIAGFKKALEFSKSDWVGLLGQYRVSSARAMSQQQGELLLGMLAREHERLSAASPGTTEVDEWANGALAGKGGKNETPF